MAKSSEQKILDKILELGENRVQELLEELSSNPLILEAFSNAVTKGTHARDVFIGVIRGVMAKVEVPESADLEKLNRSIKDLRKSVSVMEEKIKLARDTISSKKQAAEEAAKKAVQTVTATKKPAAAKPAAARKPAAAKTTAAKKSAAAKPAAARKPAAAKTTAAKKPAATRPASKKTPPKQ